MKHLISSTLLLGLFSPISAIAQQVNYYQTQQCSTYQETYVPGYYDNYGNYIQGRVNVYRYNTNCGPIQQPVVVQPQYYRQRICNPNNAAYGALIGGGLAEALSGGRGYKYNSNYTRTYNRNGSSGSYNYSYRNYKSNGWTAFGIGVGSMLFSC
jgi:hypothetical protein